MCTTDQGGRESLRDHHVDGAIANQSSRRTFLKRWAQTTVGAAAMGAFSGSGAAGAAQTGDQRGRRPRGTAHNVRVVSYSDVDGRGGAFKLAILEQRGRWYLYAGGTAAGPFSTSLIRASQNT